MDQARRKPWGTITPGRVVANLAHVAFNPWIGVICWVVFAVGMTLSAGLAITVIGGAVALAGTLIAAHHIGRFERARAKALLGVVIRPPALPFQQPEHPPFTVAAFRRLIQDSAAWRAVGYLFVQPIVGVLTFTVTYATWILGLLLISLPLLRNTFPSNSANLLIADINTTPKALVAAAFGVGVLLAAPIVTVAAGSVDVALMKALIGGSDIDRLKAQVEDVSLRRDAAVEAAEAERRRIERDLHDGAQQRLVALGMTLGLAKQNFDKDPESVRLLLDEAHTEAKSAMVELRSIARGIHPAVLDDRGLDAALSAVAARCPVPVTLLIALPNRSSRSSESTAYYVVSEALTNVAKHAQATEASVSATIRDGIENGVDHDVMHIVITDNGKGGATLAPGGGLSGLQDRVNAVNGNLAISSPDGGPTVLTVELPA
jgi:signal transduction histidine kinase